MDEQQEIQRRNELNDIRKIAATQEGKRFFRRLFAEGRIMSTTFTGNSTGFYLEGHRKLALVFLGDLVEACPEMAGEILIQTKGADDERTRTN